MEVELHGVADTEKMSQSPKAKQRRHPERSRFFQAKRGISLATVPKGNRMSVSPVLTLVAIHRFSSRTAAQFISPARQRWEKGALNARVP